MKQIKVDKDYEEISRARLVSIQKEEYRCVTGVHSLGQAEAEAQHEKDRGIRGVKILVCRSYFVCIPETEAGITLRDVAKTAKKAITVVNKAAGATLEGHNRGTESVKKFLGWKK